MPTEYTVPAEGAIPYQYFTIDPKFTEDKYIHALEAHAGNLSVVHHIVIYVREPSSQRPKRVDIGTDLLGALSPGPLGSLGHGAIHELDPERVKLLAGHQMIFRGLARGRGLDALGEGQ